MTTYKITSDMTSLGKLGALVNDDVLVGLNVDALIDGGHVKVANELPKKFDKKEQD
jgi:hypothetical protein